ncbi:MAG: DUF4157 domain-containing protein [Microcoleus sp.]
MRATATTKKQIDNAAKHKDIGKKRAYLSTGIPLLQRQCACGGGCPRCKEELGIQTKLKISEPGDRYEQEADRIAGEVMRMPEPSVQRQVEWEEEEEEEMVQRKAIVNSISPVSEGSNESEVPSIVHEVLRSPGQPLDPETLTFMESRFGHDFSQVRMHTDTKAAESAQVLNAKAYTLGKSVVFGSRQYVPNTQISKRLLAHELTHVVQQKSINSKHIQRAEVDDRNSSCAGLTDIEATIDGHVNAEIRRARSTIGIRHISSFLVDVRDRLGGRTPISPIEGLIESLPATHRHLSPTSLSGSRYEGAESVNRFWFLHTLGRVHVEGAAVNIRGICVGADKLGHFFQQGYEYFFIARGSGGTSATAESTGRSLEIGEQGLLTTGVYSNADLAANSAGLQFYDDLLANPRSYTFQIRNYISARWNEVLNPNYYESRLAEIVWHNVLRGPWSGFFSIGSSSSSVPIETILTVSSGTVAGSYTYTDESSSVIRGRIGRGRISYSTTPVTGTGGLLGISSSATPVNSITIDFDWQQGSLSGKGVWHSRNEQTLLGTWGTGTSNSNGGTWNMTKP